MGRHWLAFALTALGMGFLACLGCSDLTPTPPGGVTYGASTAPTISDPSPIVIITTPVRASFMVPGRVARVAVVC